MTTDIAIQSTSPEGVSNYILSLGNVIGKFAVGVQIDGLVRIAAEDDPSYKEFKYMAGIFEFTEEYQPRDLAQESETVKFLYQTLLDAWNV